jgi:uncharacterized protein with PIN domain
VIIDSSAILAVVGREPGYERILHALQGKDGTCAVLQENAITTVACCAYAIASLAGEPLLCVGDDFAKTDLPRLLTAAGEEPAAFGRCTGHISLSSRRLPVTSVQY